MSQNEPSRTGVVVDVTPTDYGYELQVSMGNGVSPITVDHYDAPGCEMAPFPGDYVAVVRGAGPSKWRANGYSRSEMPQATSGEIRFFTRDADGAVTGSFWFKKDGSLEIVATKATVNGVLIESDGTFTAPAEVYWQGNANKVAASKHLHNHPMGPTVGDPLSPPGP
jgi:hypothetical protein